MSNRKSYSLEQLRLLGLNADEATLYLELLQEPATYLRLSYATGINRTKVYRLVAELEKKSLVAKRSDERGAFLTAADPSTLEVGLADREEKVRRQRQALTALLPSLTALQNGETSRFIIRTYEGDAGFKQMLWHELKTKGENLLLGGGNMEDLVSDRRWVQKLRLHTTKTAYDVREILNPNDNNKPIFMLHKESMHGAYRARTIEPDVISLQNQMTIYNDTVGIYHWQEEQKVGIEIINKPYAIMMRGIFEHLWEIARDTDKNLWLA
ncbi:MAG TPA: helix-turn-helix domain-containing protein [Candidatus Chromulinivoraceae bacterium]|nr:helix-turn-helix domain-containing protein [Candidatus Chromulinivoraceae bacterium]